MRAPLINQMHDYKQDNDISDHEIERGLVFVAGLIKRQGDTYWPLLERLDEELDKRRSRDAKLSLILKKTDFS